MQSRPMQGAVVGNTLFGYLPSRPSATVLARIAAASTRVSSVSISLLSLTAPAPVVPITFLLFLFGNGTNKVENQTSIKYYSTSINIDPPIKQEVFQSTTQFCQQQGRIGPKERNTSGKTAVPTNTDSILQQRDPARNAASFALGNPESRRNKVLQTTRLYSPPTTRYLWRTGIQATEEVPEQVLLLEATPGGRLHCASIPAESFRLQTEGQGSVPSRFVFWQFVFWL